MNKEEVLVQLRDLHYNLKNFESIESTEDDVQALEIAMNIIDLSPLIDDIDGKIKYFEEVVWGAYFAKEIGDVEVGKNLELFIDILKDYKSLKEFLEEGAVG